MTKNSKLCLKNKRIINKNRDTITAMMSGTETVKRINNLNWLRHEISYVEPSTLFYLPKKEQQLDMDFTCNKNLGEAYDYIITHPDTMIDEYEICRIHSTLCNGTYLEPVGGHYRDSNKILDITVNGERFYAPEAYDIPLNMTKIIYNLRNYKISPLNKAFNIHYQLIALQPFEDFNKRTARLIMNWVLIQHGYSPIVFNCPSDKQNYKKAIALCASGDIKAYTAYMTSCMVRTENSIINVLQKSRTL
ncbi:MAG: Fic family protein [Proteobacteria bacterium]|nr:Fic family protein [Candidatus Enterousia scatequi]